jgi:putative SOS response-associated peptidase YedK
VAARRPIRHSGATCGRYTVTRHDQIAADFEVALGDVAASPWWRPRFNVAPTQLAPVVWAGPAGRAIALMRWGLEPPGARGGRTAPPVINARAETLATRPMFREALARRRCLVPADGFFEWLRSSTAGRREPPQPIYFHPEGERLDALAGLWMRARTPHGEDVLSFAIITTTPSELVRPVHDRMPAILPRGAYAAWLDPSVDVGPACAVLAEASTAGWRATPVSRLVNRATVDVPECVAPASAAPPSAQRSLFE